MRGPATASRHAVAVPPSHMGHTRACCRRTLYPPPYSRPQFCTSVLRCPPCVRLLQRVVDLLRLKAALQVGTELEAVPLHLPLQASPLLPATCTKAMSPAAMLIASGQLIVTRERNLLGVSLSTPGPAAPLTFLGCAPTWTPTPAHAVLSHATLCCAVQEYSSNVSTMQYLQDQPLETVWATFHACGADQLQAEADDAEQEQQEEQEEAEEEEQAAAMAVAMAVAAAAAARPERSRPEQQPGREDEGSEGEEEEIDDDDDEEIAAGEAAQVGCCCARQSYSLQQKWQPRMPAAHSPHATHSWKVPGA